MLLFQHADALGRWLRQQGRQGRQIGFVPTMGALHEGHFALMAAAAGANDWAVCSIFVNPTQFNNPQDLATYPRSTARDIQLLASLPNAVLYLPAEADVYPPGQPVRDDFDFGSLESVMEGAFRPGHFRGVGQVVKRLLDIVQPQRLYMGQKDFQQVAIVRRLLQITGLPVELIAHPTVREADGLAMSSRNVRLGPAARQAATKLSQALSFAQQHWPQHGPAALAREAQALMADPLVKVEYFEIVDGFSLQPLADFADSRFAVACTAAEVGGVRLIDNMVLFGD